MHVLIVNYEFPPLGGGAGSGSYHLAKKLVAAGHCVDVLTSAARGQARHEQLSGINVYRVTSWRKGIHDAGFRGAFTFILFAVPQFLRLTSNNGYHVIHYFFSLPTGILTLLPGPHRNIPYIVSLRGSDVPGYDPFNKPLVFFHQLLKPVTRRIWRRAQQVVAVCSSLKQTALQTDPSMGIAVIPNGVDTQLFTAVSKHDPHCFQLITVSRLIERKGIQHILQALATLPLADVHLTIVGEGNYQQTLIEQSKQLGLQDRVTFYGYCPREQLSQVFEGKHVFVLPSMAEAFGQAFVEAMAFGLPVIGAKTGGVMDVIAEENGILVDADSPEQIKDAITTLYHDRQRCQQMGKNNRNKVVEHYSWQCVAEQYDLCYQLASNSRSESYREH